MSGYGATQAFPTHKFAAKMAFLHVVRAIQIVVKVVGVAFWLTNEHEQFNHALGSTYRPRRKQVTVTTTRRKVRQQPSKARLAYLVAREMKKYLVRAFFVVLCSGVQSSSSCRMSTTCGDNHFRTPSTTSCCEASTSNLEGRSVPVSSSVSAPLAACDLPQRQHVDTARSLYGPHILPNPIVHLARSTSLESQESISDPYLYNRDEQTYERHTGDFISPCMVPATC